MRNRQIKGRIGMTIHLPADLERSIRAAVDRGQFASVDAAMVEAARLLLHRVEPVVQPAPIEATGDPILGLMRDDLDLMDEIVADAYRQRPADPWREIAVE